jgi:hypothetical protein
VSVETSLKREGDSRLQARSPARGNQSNTRERSDDKTIEGEQRGNNEDRSEEQSASGSGSSGEQHMGIDRWSKKKKAREQRQPDRGNGGNELDSQSAQADSLWLKSILPEASSGWWDVYQKDNGFAIKFRWRDQRRQTLTFPKISYQQLQGLRDSAPDEAQMTMREQTSSSLRRFLIDPEKRDKALIVARKLGIDPDAP